VPDGVVAAIFTTASPGGRVCPGFAVHCGASCRNAAWRVILVGFAAFRPSASHAAVERQLTHGSHPVQTADEVRVNDVPQAGSPAWPPKAQGLYDPSNERDACGLGFIANIKGRKSHDIITQGLRILTNLTHRGATGADPLQGDGAGILLQLPDAFFRILP